MFVKKLDMWEWSLMINITYINNVCDIGPIKDSCGTTADNQGKYGHT